MEHYAPLKHVPTDLLLPDRAAALALLRERLDADVGRERVLDRVLLDSFDGRLRAEGLRAEWRGRSRCTSRAPRSGGRRSRRRRAISSRSCRRAPCATGSRACSRSVRCCRPYACAVSCSRSQCSTGRARRSCSSRRAGRGGGRPGTAGAAVPRFSVRPVLGYDAEQRRVLYVLRELEPAEQPLFDQAVIAAGGLPEGVSAKPRVTLPAGTPTTPPRPRS